MNQYYTPDSGRRFDIHAGIAQKRPMDVFASLILSKLWSLLLLAFLSTMLTVGQAYATDIYLNSGGTGGGTSWDDAKDFNTYFSAYAGMSTAANSLPAGTHVYIKEGNYTYSNNLGVFLINNDLLIQGSFPSSAVGTDRSGYNPVNHPTKITLNSSTSGAVYFLAANELGASTNTKTIKGLEGTATVSASFFNGNPGGNGAAGTLNFIDLNVHDLPGGNGAVFLKASNTGGPSFFNNCLFTNNKATGPGGINNIGVTRPLSVSNCSFVGNQNISSSTWGGAIFSATGGAIIDSYFCSNVSPAFGGAIGSQDNIAVTYTISGSTFYDNQANGGSGGAIAVNNGTLSITNSKFYENKATATLGGGAVYVNVGGSTAHTITGSIFYKNFANMTSNIQKYGGGAIQISSASRNWTISNSKFVANYASGTGNETGGAINFFNNISGQTVTIDGNLFYGNTTNGGPGTAQYSDIAAYRQLQASYGKYIVSNTKLQTAQSTYTASNGFTPNPAPYDFSSNNNTFGNTTDDGGVTAFTGSCPSSISPICLAADDPAPSFATTAFSSVCPVTTVTLPSTATNQNADVTLTWHSATPTTNANKLPSNVVSTTGTYYAAFYDPIKECYSPNTTPVTVIIAACPDLTPIIYARPGTVYNTTPITVVVDVLELKGVATSGLITVKVTKDPLVSLSFPATSGSVGGRSVQNGSWSYDGVSDPGYYIFTTTTSILAGDQLSLGMEGTLTPGATGGSVTISVTISGGEVKVSNNADADKIDYFQQ